MAVLAGVKLAVLLTLDLGAPTSSAGLASKAIQASGQFQAKPAPVAAQAFQASGSALAQSGQVVRAAILDDSQAQAQTTPPAPPSQPKPQQQAGPESVLTIQQLKTRADELDRKEQALKTLESDLNARLAKLQELEKTLTSMLADAKSIKEEKMRHLIDVYTNMKSKQAGSVLETLDENVAVKILAGMKGRTAGEILTNVSAKKAAKLSEDLTKLQIGPDLPDHP